MMGNCLSIKFGEKLINDKKIMKLFVELCYNYDGETSWSKLEIIKVKP